MGFWGTGAMDGDGPLNLRGEVARAAVKILSAALYEEDDGRVFAAAHIAMDLQESGILGLDYYMFVQVNGLAHLIRNRVASVKISKEWGGPDDEETIERIEVRRALLIRLDSLKARHRASLETALGIARSDTDTEVVIKNEESKRPCPGCDVYDCDGGHP